MRPFKKILLIRLDKIGDLVLTLPVDQGLAGGGMEVVWVIPKGLAFIGDHAFPKRRYIELDKATSWKKFWNFVAWIKHEKPDSAVVFHGPWWLGLALFIAGVPRRVTKLSQWHSFLFFNRGIRQKRSLADSHELEYNYQLVEQGFAFPKDSLLRETLELHADPSQLRKFQLTYKNYFVVHPGMAGSAQNWPMQNYQSLIKKLIELHDVVITGTTSDQAYLSTIESEFKTHPKVKWLVGQATGSELIAILQGAKAVVAPSTGVLHLAASTGTPTIGIYSPVRVQQPKRWGPKGLRTSTLMPQVTCPGELKCLNQNCPIFDCMYQISPEQVFESLKVAIK